MPTVDFPGRGPVWLPEPFVEFRPHQVDAINETLDLFASGVDLVLVDAPTGAGKTVIGETTRILHPSIQSLYLCTTKGLQDQFLDDFPHAQLIKGRSNYPTLDYPSGFNYGIDASVCTLERVDTDSHPLPACPGCRSDTPDLTIQDKSNEHSTVRYSHCEFCHPFQFCPYRQAKDTALHAPLAVANTAYYLNEANNVGRFSDFDKDDDRLVVIDEADTLEGLMMQFMEVRLSKGRMKQIKMPPPERKTVASTWLEWAALAEIKLQDEIQSIWATVRRNPDMDDADRFKKIRSADALSKIRSSVVRFREELAVNPDNWVHNDEYGGISFRPVEVAEYGDQLLWRHARNMMLMSATLISPASMMEFLGYKGSWATVTVDSNFDPERRPVWVTPAANMSYKTKDTEWPKMVNAVGAIIDRHPDVRILVHTVSYEFTRYLFDNLREQGKGERLLTYTESKERDPTLERFRRSPNGVVLAPSFDRGVDLPGDEARVIVVTKVPFPFLGDKQVSQRLHGTGIAGKTWYAMETIRSLVQMTGRGMRHKDDWCISYILDRQFQSNIWASKRHLIPKWWTASVKWGPPTNGGREAIERAPVPRRLG